MTEAAAINFGPAWLRDTFAPPSGGASDHGGGGGGGGGPTGGKTAAPIVMSPAKLADFRYGKEEMLAFFNLSPDASLPPHQEKVVAQAGLLAEKPQIPLNLMGPMSEEEQRTWSRGANSDTSLRLYRKENPNAGMGPGGGPGLGRGSGERGRGRGRGFFERHRGPPEDDEGIGRRDDGSRPFGRGGA